MSETDEKSQGFKELVKEHDLDTTNLAPPPKTAMTVRDVIAALMQAEDLDAELAVSVRGSQYYSVNDVNFDGENTPYIDAK